MLNIAETLNYTEQEKNYLYDIGANKCQIGDFKGAVLIFQFLNLLDSQNCLYSKAIAGCMHGLENYSSAVYYYCYSYELVKDRNNYDCLFYVAKCHLKLNDNLEAKNSLNQFIDLCEKDKVAQDMHSKLIKKAKLLLKGIVINDKDIVSNSAEVSPVTK